jgi:DME family drug/metabolite transporter
MRRIFDLRGVLLGVAAAVLWSMGGLGISWVSGDGLSIAGFRSASAVPVFFLAIFLSAERTQFFSRLREPLFWGASFAYAFTVVFFVWANKLTSSAHAILLQYTAPIWVAFLSWPLLRERLQWADAIAVTGCVAGVFALVGGDATRGLLSFGNLVALMSGVGFAVLTLGLRFFGRRSQSGNAALSVVALGNVLAVVCTLPWMIRMPLEDPSSLMIALGMGVLQIGVAYLFFVAAIQRLSAVAATLIAALEPILNPAWVALASGTPPPSHVLLGGFFIVSSVTLSTIFKSKKGVAP